MILETVNSSCVLYWSTLLMCSMDTLLWCMLLVRVAQPLYNTWLTEQQLKLMPQIMWVIVTVYSVLLYMYIGYLWINTSIIGRNWVIELALIIQYMLISNELVYCIYETTYIRDCICVKTLRVRCLGGLAIIMAVSCAATVKRQTLKGNT